jgi:3-dehydroquinate synthase
MNRRTVRINVQNGYDVIIENGILSSCGTIIRPTVKNGRAAVITDSNVAPLYLQTVIAALGKADIKADSFIIEAGERSKNLDTLSEILEFLAEKRFTKSDTVIALGGGVVGDIAGFAAAVYLRGVSIIQIPTTLLSAVDSSVGGKTAVNLRSGKNLAGAFMQPAAVIFDPDALSSLPRKEFENGMAEVIKYGVLFSEELFETVKNGADSNNIAEIAEKCVVFKGRTVENDEFDAGERKLLNLGHTIGHAIEKCSNYTISHGFAVASGMAMAARAGEKMGITQAGTAEAIEKALEKYSLPTDTSFDPCSLASCALSDKKRAGETITAVIPERIGKCRLHGISVGELEDFIKKGKKQ